MAFLKVDYKKDKLRFLSGLEMRRVKGNMFPGYVAFFLVCGVVSTYQRQRSKEVREEMRIRSCPNKLSSACTVSEVDLTTED